MSENRAIVKMYKRRMSKIGLRLFTMCIRTLGTADSACTVHNHEDKKKTLQVIYQVVQNTVTEILPED